jgi:hypothetical protein
MGALRMGSRELVLFLNDKENFINFPYCCGGKGVSDHIAFGIDAIIEVRAIFKRKGEIGSR